MFLIYKCPNVVYWSPCISDHNYVILGLAKGIVTKIYIIIIIIRYGPCNMYHAITYVGVCMI
jgi:hypothetical protein